MTSVACCTSSVATNATHQCSSHVNYDYCRCKCPSPISDGTPHVPKISTLRVQLQQWSLQSIPCDSPGIHPHPRIPKPPPSARSGWPPATVSSGALRSLRPIGFAGHVAAPYPRSPAGGQPLYCKNRTTRATLPHPARQAPPCRLWARFVPGAAGHSTARVAMVSARFKLAVWRTRPQPPAPARRSEALHTTLRVHHHHCLRSVAAQRSRPHVLWTFS